MSVSSPFPEPQLVLLAHSSFPKPLLHLEPHALFFASATSKRPLLSPGLLLQVLSVLLSLVGDVLIVVYRSEGGNGAGSRAGPAEARADSHLAESCSRELGLGPRRGAVGFIRVRGLSLPPFFREVCSIRFLLTAVSLLSLFLAGEMVVNPLGPQPWMLWSRTWHIFSYIPQPTQCLQLLSPLQSPLAPLRHSSPLQPFLSSLPLYARETLSLGFP